MDTQKITEKKVNAITVMLFALGMIILIWFDWLPIWAAAMASCFVAITTRQFIIGRIADIFMSMIFFGLLFITNSVYYSEMWTGVLLIIGAFYIFARQCFEIYFEKSSKVTIKEPISVEVKRDSDDDSED